jgi:hypothetical protein
LLKVDAKKEETTAELLTKKEDKPFTDDALLAVWKAFAETRKLQQADYQLLSQPYERRAELMVIPLSNPIQETMLNEFKLELTTFLRDRLQNNTIQVVGELQATDDKKMIYTPRDKFEYLMNKNPMIKELKERFNLDVDF